MKEKKEMAFEEKLIWGLVAGMSIGKLLKVGIRYFRGVDVGTLDSIFFALVGLIVVCVKFRVDIKVKRWFVKKNVRNGG